MLTMPSVKTHIFRKRTALVLPVVLAVLAGLAQPEAFASRTQWSIFEDHRYLVRTDAAGREATLDEIVALGADTLRVQVMWWEVAPSPASRTRPAFDASNPAEYPGFEPYDDLVRRATAKGLRVMITITGDTPVWATSRGRGRNYRPSVEEFGRFASAVGRRYSGTFGDLPAVRTWSIWNEPNLPRFLEPQSPHRRAPAAHVYRSLVNKAVATLRDSGHSDSLILAGELAPVAPRNGPGPLRFLRTWLCLDVNYKRLRGRAARRNGCARFRKLDVDGFAIHAYTRPIPNYKPRGDAVTLNVISRLARALDKAARAGRVRSRMPIYNTEFGIQTNPPDPYQGGSPSRQAQIINESEEFSYRYPRLKSYSQYLLFDDPPRPGPRFERYSGFESGLRFTEGEKKTAYDAYRFPIAVRRVGRRVLIWGRVRPGTGTRYVRLQRRTGGRFVDAGAPIATNALGYFRVRKGSGSYRFLAFQDSAGTTPPLGASRTARPAR
jgi:hypothetical protein